MSDVPTKIALFDITRIETSEPREFFDYGLAFSWGKVISLRQRLGIVTHCEGLSFTQEGFQILALQVRGDFLVIVGVRRVSWKFKLINEIVGTAPDRLQVQCRADQDQAVKRDSPVNEIAGQTGGAEGPVALASDEQRRNLTVVPHQVHSDEFADGLNVAIDAVHPARDINAPGAAITGAHRIDEDKVSFVEPCILVVFEL